jgi:hypothetical protein
MRRAAMKRKRREAALSLVVLILVILGCARSGQPTRELPTAPPRAQETASPPQEEEVNGSLEEVNSVKVLRVWGSRREMGYAHGYLLADDLVDLFERYLFGSVLESLPNGWRDTARRWRP